MEPLIPAGHGFHRGSALCRCGRLIIKCEAMTLWGEQRRKEAALEAARKHTEASGHGYSGMCICSWNGPSIEWTLEHQITEVLRAIGELRAA